MRETRNLEFKEKMTNTFLKTVSAYANYENGQIKFGIKDNGAIVGVKNPAAFCLEIENKINDSIKPNPDYHLSIDKQTQVVTLTVEKGPTPPYFYKNKAYKRNDSASVPVDPVTLSRLILAGRNRSYDSLRAEKQDLAFTYLENALKKELGIQKLTSDLLITLDLKRKNEGYTVAGELFADKNDYRGIDVVRFGQNINIMADRRRCEKTSILRQYDVALAKYRQYYEQEEIKGTRRIKINQIPEEAFREAVANALVHRTWDVNAQIKISLFENRIEIVSPGGLPAGSSKEEYLQGQISILRNPIVANIFFRLGLIEQFGTGIQRIISAYAKSTVQPQFHLYANSIKVILPVVQFALQSLSADQNEVYRALANGPLSSTELTKEVDFGKTKVLKILRELVNKGYLERMGQGRSVRYLQANKSR